MTKRRTVAVQSDVRARILAAGQKHFAERGFEGASTRAIVGEAEANQGLVAYYFGDKESLWREVVQQGCAAFAAELALHKTPRELHAALPHAIGVHAALLRLLAHALCEAGTRRDWLVREQLLPLCKQLLPARDRDDASELARVMMVAAATLALACAPDVATADMRSLQRAAIDAWLAPAPRAPVAAGPWSLAAAARRRAANP